MYNLIEYIPKTMTKLQEISNKLFDEKIFVTAAILSSRNIELYNKIIHRLDILEESYNYLIGFELGNFEYKKIDFNKIKAELKAKYIHNIEEFSKITIGLYLEKYNIEENQLDFIGQAYYQLTFIMLEIIYDNDYESFEKLYARFFVLCSISDSYIRDLIPTTWNPSYVANKYTMTTINFMNISGFAMYYSHLIKDDRWEQLVIKYAEELVSKDEGKEKIITRCKTCAKIHRENTFIGSLLESSIKNSIENFIRNSNMIKFKSVGSFYEKVVDSEDELIQKFNYSDMGFSYNFYEIYLYFCINNYCAKDEEKYKTKNSWAEEDKKNV